MSVPSGKSPLIRQSAILQSVLAGLVYPIVVTRVFPSVYIRGCITLVLGSGERWIAPLTSHSEHSTPIDADGNVSAGCRDALVDAT